MQILCRVSAEAVAINNASAMTCMAVITVDLANMKGMALSVTSRDCFPSSF